MTTCWCCPSTGRWPPGRPRSSCAGSSSTPCMPPRSWWGPTSASGTAPAATWTPCGHWGPGLGFTVEASTSPAATRPGRRRSCARHWPTVTSRRLQSAGPAAHGRGRRRGGRPPRPRARLSDRQRPDLGDGRRPGRRGLRRHPARLDDPAAPLWPAAVSVGTNPTFEGVERRVESYVLDRDDLELYGVAVGSGSMSGCGAGALRRHRGTGGADGRRRRAHPGRDRRPGRERPG